MGDELKASHRSADAGDANDEIRSTVDGIYRSDSRHVLATLIRLLGDFDLAEEALHDAFAAAAAAYARAHALARQEPERRFLARRLVELGESG